jgi:hypothetical protein
MTNFPGVPAEIAERIISAANNLFEAGGRKDFPTVDQVRRAARTDMNAASAVMRDWRRAQTAKPAATIVDIPAQVVQLHTAALGSLWQQAQELANESLRTAAAAWETERAELDALRAQVAQAHVALEEQLEQVQLAAESAAREHQAAAQFAAQEQATLSDACEQAQIRAERAEATAEEIQVRTAELSRKLDAAEQQLQTVSIELAAARERGVKLEGELLQAQAAQAVELERAQLTSMQLDQARGELSQTQILADRETHKTEGLQDQVVELKAARERAEELARTNAAELSAARERAAKLEGQLEAVQEQNAALLATLKTDKLSS